MRSTHGREGRRDGRHTSNREPQSGRRQDRVDLAGPTAEELVDAIEAIQDHDVPGTPAVSAVETIQEATDFPFAAGSRVIKSAGITKGRPMHGELRSDTHISHYAVELPLREVDREIVEADECPVCGETRATYQFSAHHNIAGSRSITCTFCDETHHSEEWG